MRTTRVIRCRHGIDGDTCPACADEQQSEHEAVRLAARDPQAIDDLRREFLARLEAGCLGDGPGLKVAS